VVGFPAIASWLASWLAAAQEPPPAAGAAVDAATATRWELLAPTRMTAANGTTLSLDADRSVVLGGTVAPKEVLTLECATEQSKVNGFRLEMLCDPAKPGTGPGLAMNGNFVLQEFVIEQAPRNSDGFKPVLLERPLADFEQQGWPIIGSIDGAAHTGWAVAPEFGRPHVATFEAQQTLGYDAGVKFRIRLDFNFGDLHLPARLRLAVTSSPPPFVLPRDDRATIEAQGRIPTAIQRGTQWLLAQQELDGLWSERAHDIKHGMTALAGYTLLKCGHAPSHPAVQRAKLRLLCEPASHTYAAGFELMFLGELFEKGDAALLGRIEETTRRLISWQQGPGGFSYPAGGADLSNGQYAALGLRAAARCGVKIDPPVWIKLGDETLAHQEKSTGGYDGAGFGYAVAGAPTGSMTAGGTCVLKIVDEQLAKTGMSKAAYATGWRKGVGWLDREFSADTNPRVGGSWLWYWLYGVERVGGLCDVDELAGKNWYREGARIIVGAQQGDGAWPGDGGPQPSTCFALLFLARATSSVSGVATRGKDLYGDDDPARDVSLRASGDSPLAVWVSSFGGVAEQFGWPEDEGRGPRVAEVLYVSPGKTLLGDAHDVAAAWRISDAAAAADFATPAFDDSRWRKEPGAFGDPTVPELAVRTEWKSGELLARREFVIDGGPLVAPELRVTLAPPPTAGASAPLLRLFDEEPEFAAALRERSGESTVTVKEGGAANGRLALAVTPTQVYAAQLPGWRFPIAADPRAGEYRWLRVNWRKDGPGGLMFQLAANGSWDHRTVRFHSGPNDVNWPGVQLEKDSPKQWTSETIDLHAAFGGATMLTGIALVPMNAGTGWFDAIYLARTRADLDGIQRSAAGIAAIPRPPGAGVGAEAATATTDGAAAPAGGLEVFVNGTLIWRGEGPLPPLSPVPTLRPLAELLVPGKNLVALRATRGTGVAAFDLAIVDQALLARVAGDPARPSGGERFAAQVAFERNATVPIRAVVRIAAPPEKQPPEQLLLGSNELTVQIREALDPELLSFASDAGRNLLGPGAANATASSRFTADFEPAFALDNMVHRGWLSADGDQKPVLTLELRKPVRADTVLVAPLQQRHFEAERRDWKVRRVEVSIDRGKGGTFELLLPEDGRKGVLRLPKVAVVRRLDLRILDTARRPAGKSAVGLGEVELQLTASKSAPTKPAAGK
jgi:hypothetical protein